MKIPATCTALKSTSDLKCCSLPLKHPTPSSVRPELYILYNKLHLPTHFLLLYNATSFAFNILFYHLLSLCCERVFVS